jgi:uncharacterized protein (DUF1778 family)
MSDTPTTTVLSVRVSLDERALLESAAEQSRTSLSEFVRRKSLEAAEVDVLSRNVVTIPAKDWDKFESWLHEKPRGNQRLKKLAALKPTWKR